MPFLPVLFWILGGVAVSAAGWAGYRFYVGDPIMPGKVIKFGRSKRGDVVNEWAAKHGVDPRMIDAVIRIESGGRAALLDGRPVIRLELHYLRARIPTRLRLAFDRIFRLRGPKPWQGHEVQIGGAWRPLHQQSGETLKQGQDREWAAFDAASQLDPEAAARSISMGLGQVMGKWFAELGYATAQDMLADAKRGETQQVRQMLGYIEHVEPKALAGLQAGDLVAFATAYNGPGQPQYYAGLIQTAYDELAARDEAQA